MAGSFGGEVLRVVGRQEIVHRAEEYPGCGFRTEEVTVELPNGGIATKELVHVFQARACQCVVRDSSEWGRTCPYCRALLARSLRGVSVEARKWMATPCHRHFFVCAHPMCKFGGACRKHGVPLRDGRFLCWTHAREFERGVKRQALEVRHGRLGALLITGVLSLFELPERLG